jgi:hypothetical protein
MRALLIDAHQRKVTEIALPGPVDGSYREQLDEMYKLIGCDCVTGAGGDESGDRLTVDDEGLLKLTPQTPFFFLPTFYPQPLAGNGIVSGVDEGGETIDAKSTVAEIEAAIQWMTLGDAIEWGDKQAADEAAD